MPQSWQKLPCYQIPDMTEDQLQLREAIVHGFGNLTILTQPLNSSVSNGSFADSRDEEGNQVLGKRSRLGQSALLMNTYFHQTGLSTWDDAAVAARAKELCRAAILVWPRPFNGEAAPAKVASALAGHLA